MKTKSVLMLFVVSGIFLISSPCKAAVAGGNVIDQDGSPVAGAIVHAVAMDEVAAADQGGLRAQPAKKLSAKTDEQGAFELSVSEGTLSVGGNHRPYGLDPGFPDRGPGQACLG